MSENIFSVVVGEFQLTCERKLETFAGMFLPPFYEYTYHYKNSTRAIQSSECNIRALGTLLKMVAKIVKLEVGDEIDVNGILAALERT